MTTQENIKKIDELRKEAKALIKKTKGECVAMRSCWNCNAAHEYFKRGKWGDWVLWCFECGKFYFKRKDITIHKEYARLFRNWMNPSKK
jgi:hypothetical protein